MSFDDSTYHEMSRFLNNEMSPTEKEAFEKMLKENPELADFVNTFQSIDHVYNEKQWTVKSSASIEEIKALAREFKAEDVVNLSGKIRSIQKRETETKIPKKRTYFQYIASAVAVAAVCTLLYFSFLPSLTAEQAFERYHDWSSLPSFQTKSDSENKLAKAETLFRQKKYKEALEIFKDYEQNNTTYDPKIQLYIGVSYLELDNSHEAIQTFDTLLQSDAIDHHKAYWYLALTYLKQNDTKNAKKTLTMLIENTSNFNYSKAKELLKKLK
ncbi:tetratricopeptide repeat protein [Kordia zhangzhouensis]|uniref:tetratricopeptide repeat protein n=1 Tax=Kordia zhangzhouensis TaxID=1620405 RepID=UPI000629551F|nr:tetratricopeptide repeat protein [Kordia zhangzhouensis]